MKLLIIAHEFPYPANHGGKADIWNRIQVLKQQGHEIFLLTWSGIKKGEKPNAKEIAVVKKTVSQLLVLEIPRSARRMLDLLNYPSLVAARILRASQLKSIFLDVRKFDPDTILIDGIYAGKTGLALAKQLGVPVYLRLHNIEHRYMLGQFKMARTFRSRLSIFANLLHLKTYEHQTIKSANAYFDISLDDLQFWKKRGYKNGFWLPPTLIKNNSEPIGGNKAEKQQVTDIGFLGNLNAPNNVQGLLWFIMKVFPLIVAKKPSVQFFVLGSQPSPEVTQAIENSQNIHLIANPENPDIYLEQVQVLINPVQFGSGVNVKTIDMLFRNNQVVTTSTGVTGLPKEFADVFFVADEPSEFAHNVLEILEGNYSKNPDERNELRKLFGSSSVEILEKIYRKQSRNSLDTKMQPTFALQ